MDVEFSPQEPEGWNSFLEKNDGVFHQSTFNVEYLKPLGFEPLYFTAEKNHSRAGQLLAFKTTFFHATSLGTPFEILLPVGKKFFPCMQEMYGPVAENKEAYSALVFEFAQQAKKTKSAVSIAKPHPMRDLPSAFSAAGFVESPSATFIVDLSKGESELFKKIDPSARKKIRQCQEAGVRARATRDKGEVAEYFRIADENRKRNGLKPYSQKSYWGMWSSFEKSGGKLFIAEKQGEILGGIMISAFGGYVNEWSPSISGKAMEEKLYAGDLLHWKIIEWGSKNGCKHYDLTGVAVQPKNAKEQGIFDFKAKWGGELVKSNEYFLKGNSLTHKLLEKMRKIVR